MAYSIEAFRQSGAVVDVVDKAGTSFLIRSRNGIRAAVRREEAHERGQSHELFSCGFRFCMRVQLSELLARHGVGLQSNAE